MTVVPTRGFHQQGQVGHLRTDVPVYANVRLVSGVSVDRSGITTKETVVEVQYMVRNMTCMSVRISDICIAVCCEGLCMCEEHFSWRKTDSAGLRG
jgi:hypothetical protein